MSVAGGMMWRLSSLFNYIRGSVRSGAWRVRETPSQLLSDDHEDRDDQRTPVPEIAASPAGRPAYTPPRALISSLTVPHGRREVGSLSSSRRPLEGQPASDTIRLPAAAALWYVSLAGQPAGASAAAGSASAGATPAVTVAGSVRSCPGACLSSPTSVDSTASTAATQVTSVTATTPAPASVPASASVLAPASVDNPAPDPAPASDPASAPAAASVAAAAAVEDRGPLDALSSLRVSFAAEHDRLMAGLQNAAGTGVAARRPHQALECFRAAAALGSPAAWFNCGICFQQGRGTTVDLEKAAECYEEAVRLGHAVAGYNLALLAAANSQVTSQYDVIGLLERAASAGCGEAAEFLETWSAWSEEQEQEQELDAAEADWWLGLGGTPGRSVSLPVLGAGLCGPEADADAHLDPCGAGRHELPGAWPDGRQPVLFYLHESP